MYRQAHPTETTKQFDAIRNILNTFPAITEQIQTCEELVRSTRGKKLQHFHKSCISKWKFVGNCVNEKDITESVLVKFEAFLKSKIAEYTAEHEKMLAKGVPFKPRDLSFIPRYFEVAKKYLNETYTYETLIQHLESPKRLCSIAQEFLKACDEIFLSKYPNSYETVEALYEARNNKSSVSAKKLIAHALKDHPGPQATGSDGLSILAAAATLAEEAPAAAESRFEASAAAESRFEATAALSYIEQGVGSLDLDPMEPEATFNDGTESGGFGREYPEPPRTEGELPLPFTTFAECGFPLHFPCPGGAEAGYLACTPPPAPAPPARCPPPALRAGGAPRGGAGVGDPDRDGGAPAEGGRGGDARGPALLFIHPPSAPNIPAPNHLQEDGHSEDAAGEDDALAGWQTVEPEAAASAFCRRRSCKKRGRRRHRDKRKLTAVTTYVAIKVFSEESKDSVLDKLRHHGIRACDVLRRPQLWIIVVTFVDGEGPTTIGELTSEIDKTAWEFKVPVTKHVSCHVLTYCSHHDVIVAKSRNA